mgnify:CR=1 FL=1
MKIKNLRYWLVVLVILLIGIGLLYIDEAFVGENNKLVSSILNKAATAVIITGLFSLLNTIILRKNLINLIHNKIKLKQGIDEVGVIDLFTDIRDIDFRDYFKNCKNEIDILHVYGQTWTSNHEQAIVDALNKKKCKIRVIILSEESPFISGLTNYYGYNEEQLRKKINEVKNTWQNILGRVNGKSTKKRLKIYEVNMLPAYALYRFDNTLIKIDTRLISKAKTKELNALICIDNEFDPSYFSNYMRDFNLLLSDNATNELFK